MLPRQLIHLGHHRRFDLRRRRWRRWRRTEPRPPRRNHRLSDRGVARTKGRHNSANQQSEDHVSCHDADVVIPTRNRNLNYSSGAFSIGSNRSASRPSRFHDCSMYGGKGAMTSRSAREMLRSPWWRQTGSWRRIRCACDSQNERDDCSEVLQVWLNRAGDRHCCPGGVVREFLGHLINQGSRCAGRVCLLQPAGRR